MDFTNLLYQTRRKNILVYKSEGMGVVPINLMNMLNPTMSATSPVGSDFLTLRILVYFPIHIDTISMGLPIVYFKGAQVEFYKYFNLKHK